ncbi:hypothetical protein D3C84_1124930 [compost metagenome]
MGASANGGTPGGERSGGRETHIARYNTAEATLVFITQRNKLTGNVSSITSAAD